MLPKRAVKPIEEDKIPGVDEGWWTSVLADDQMMPQTVKETSSPFLGMSFETELVDWDLVQSLYNQDEIVILQVYGYNRGGVLVRGNGLQGFVPVSHLVELPNNIEDEERRHRLAGYVGRSLQLKVIECQPSLERIVFSERAALAGEGRRKQLFRSLSSGELVSGVVTNVTDFGVFVDLGGVEGLVHVSELSWGRVQHPSDILQVGQDIQALVLQVCEENARVALSIKRLCENPWETLSSRYKQGDQTEAVITSIMQFGAFARLNEGVEGLIHISSISSMRDHNNLEKVFHIGQAVQVQILHIDAERRRLGLGLVLVE